MNGIEYHSGWIFTDKTLGTINGNMMAIIEGIGLTEKQENAIKSQIRQALYRNTRVAMFLGAEQVAEIGVDMGLKGEDKNISIPNEVISTIE